MLALLVAQGLQREWDRGWGLEYGLNCFAVSAGMVWVEWVLLARPDGEGWRRVRRVSGEKETGEKGEKCNDGRVARNGFAGPSAHVEGVPQSFLGRLWWAARLTVTNRYVGWSCESKNVPVEVGPGYSRLQVLPSG